VKTLWSVHQDKSGSTPLHQVSLRGNVDLAHFLVKHGADATAQDKSGFNPLRDETINQAINGHFIPELRVKISFIFLFVCVWTQWPIAR
jgi:hypothetical protein